MISDTRTLGHSRSNISIKIPVRKSSRSSEKRKKAKSLVMSVTFEVPYTVVRSIEDLVNTRTPGGFEVN